ncbi:hypothetical protein EMCG_08191 [[Emmonsia] crescens]|uniref:Uncharacterized protein n=1 Tax=[Emmonsia] crescens TaxID=73230 RepID=A0A0G2I6F6_9EURO|nr:hypothetical protein EMCG_08191 [Emmonsia crescens UAMH 3008]
MQVPLCDLSLQVHPTGSGESGNVQYLCTAGRTEDELYIFWCNLTRVYLCMQSRLQPLVESAENPDSQVQSTRCKNNLQRGCIWARMISCNIALPGYDWRAVDRAAVAAGNAKTKGGWKAARPEEAMPSHFVALLGPADRQPPTSSIKESFFYSYIWRSSVSSDSCTSPNLYCRMASDLRSSKA